MIEYFILFRLRKIIKRFFISLLFIISTLKIESIINNLQYPGQYCQPTYQAYYYKFD